ncbi:hypothetical protein OIY81_568 [Cryptosporidium canis]|nr:hypothetical protein OIY81_568 [Cryptosporidium canis]
MESSVASHPLKKKQSRVLDLKLGENEELINGLKSLDSIDDASEGISKELISELLNVKGQNKCRSMQLSICRYHLTLTESCLESLRPFVDDLRAINGEIRAFEKEFNESVVSQLSSWQRFTSPLLQEFGRIQDQIQQVEDKRSMCSALLSHLSTNFVSDIRSLKSPVGDSKGSLLLSMVAIYKKCIDSETNSRRLIEILGGESQEFKSESESVLSRIRSDPSYSSMIPQILINLRALILDLELKRSQLAAEMTNFLVEQVASKSPDEFNDQLELSQKEGEETRGCVIGSQSFQEAVEILRLHHKDQCCSLLTNVIETRSKYLEYRFNHIVGHGILIGDANYSSNLLDYLESIFEWIRVCGVAIESEFLVKAFGYEVCEDCEFEERHSDFGQEGPSGLESAEHMANNTGITIGIKIAHLIDSYIEALTPMFRVLPRRLGDLREEAIAQYYVYAGIVKENVSSRASEIITRDFSISLLVMEWSSLLRDILSTIQGGVLTPGDDTTNSTLTSMLDTFINPMFNAICSASTSDKTPLASIIRINNVNYCLSALTAYPKMKLLLDKYIEIANQIIHDEVPKLTTQLKEEFCNRYRFGELVKELGAKKEALAGPLETSPSTHNSPGPSSDSTAVAAVLRVGPAVRDHSLCQCRPNPG